jgi:hypothetical protein
MDFVLSTLVLRLQGMAAAVELEQKSEGRLVKSASLSSLLLHLHH